MTDNAKKHDAASGEPGDDHMHGWPTDRAPGTPLAPRARRRAVAAITILLGVLAAACTPVTPPPPPPVDISLAQALGLFPSFSPHITDYVDRCDGTNPVTVSVQAPPGVTVSVNGQPAQGGTFSIDVSQHFGQSVAIVVSGSPTTYHIRCLPSDFPTWTVNKPGTPQASGYLVDATGSHYPTIFDANGVPVWWTTTTATTLYADRLADGNVAWISYPTGGAAEVHGLDGTLVHAVNNTTTDPADGHDLLKLANGHYVIVTNKQVDHVDLSATGISGAGNDASVLDHVVEELDPSGNVAWSWDVMLGDGAHAATQIPVTAIDAPWQGATNVVKPPVYDIYHWNSIEPVTEANGDPGFILSFRHLDAVYNVDQTTKQIVWKLGGNSEAGRSLTVGNDPVFTAGGSLRGQHDARVLSDGSVSLYDDGTATTSSFPGRAPRGVRYAIDATAMTATLLESVSNSTVGPASQCCGSARRLSGGDWVIGWGGKNNFSELTSDGTPVFTLTFTAGIGVVYRAIPITAAQWDPAALRAGMDAQFPHTMTTHSAAAQSTDPPVDTRAP